jgi:hypothetical protein
MISKDFGHTVLEGGGGRHQQECVMRFHYDLVEKRMERESTWRERVQNAWRERVHGERDYTMRKQSAR